jgi:FkbM family methyltransferase
MMYFLLPFIKPQTIFQVGAFEGEKELIDHCADHDHTLYMFEPNPKRAKELHEQVQDYPRIFVIQKAVSNFDGQAVFHIANHDDCSSLSDFDDRANETWVHKWHPYKSFQMVADIDVDVVRLDSFMAANDIRHVDLIEVDAQGEDLKVVESLGDEIVNVKKIQIEVGINHSPLYKTVFSKADAIEYFRAREFEPHISWKQSINREENIVFRNVEFYPNAILNAAASNLEMCFLRFYFFCLKLPRVLEVTRMIFRQKFAKIMSFVTIHRRKGGGSE